MDSQCTSPIDDWSSVLSGDTITDSTVTTPDSCDIGVGSGATNAFFHTVLSGDATEVRALASEGIYISPLDTWVIFEACLQGPDMIQAFCENAYLDLDQHIPGPTGDAIINYLLRTSPRLFPEGKKETISALLRQAISPIAYDQFGNHALHILAGSPEGLDVMKLFLCHTEGIAEAVRSECISHINARNWASNGSGSGNTPLTIAVLENNLKGARLLLDNGADASQHGEFDQSPLELAVVLGHCEITRLLLEYGSL